MQKLHFFSIITLTLLLSCGEYTPDPANYPIRSDISQKPSEKIINKEEFKKMDLLWQKTTREISTSIGKFSLGDSSLATYVSTDSSDNSYPRITVSKSVDSLLIEKLELQTNEGTSYLLYKDTNSYFVLKTANINWSDENQKKYLWGEMATYLYDIQQLKDALTPFTHRLSEIKKLRFENEGHLKLAIKNNG